MKPDHARAARARARSPPRSAAATPPPSRPPGSGRARHLAHARRHLLDARVGEREPIHEGPRVALDARAVEVGAIGLDDGAGLLLERARHQAERVVLHPGRRQRERAGGLLGRAGLRRPPRSPRPSSCRSLSRLEHHQVVPVDDLADSLVAQRALDVRGLGAADLPQLGRVVVDEPARELAARRRRRAPPPRRPGTRPPPRRAPRAAGSCPSQLRPSWRPRQP